MKNCDCNMDRSRVLEFARCGCNSTCNCVVTGGDCVNVSGLGTASAPYEVTVQVDNDTIICGGNGLEAVINIDVDNDDDPDCVDVTVTENGPGDFTIAADLVLAPDQPGCTITPDASGNLGTNILRCIPGTGAGVFCEDIQDVVGAMLDINAGDCLEYDDATNSFNVVVCDNVNNGLECLDTGSGECADGGLAVIPSADVGNTLIVSPNDGRLFVGGTQVAEGDCVIVTSDNGTPETFTIDVEIDPACPLITCGNDGLCVTPTPVAVLDSATIDFTITGTGQPGDAWEITGDACIAPIINVEVVDDGTAAGCLSIVQDAACPADPEFTLTLGVSDDDCNSIECRADGLFSFGDPLTQVPDFTGTNYGGAQGPFGPFNGTFGATQVGPIICETVTNPSTCKNLNVSVSANNAFSDLRQDSGEFVHSVEVSFSGPGGPFARTGNFGTDDQTHNATHSYDGNIQGQTNSFILGPGGSIEYCARITVRGTNVVNGRIGTNALQTAMISAWATG